MSDETTTESPETPETEAAPESATTDKPLGENGEKALKAERTRATAAEKERDALKAELDKIAEANLSELEKAQKQAEEYRTAAEQATVQSLRFRIAAETGINDNVDLILTASDEETMRRQAALWADRSAKSDTAAGPRPDLTQGGSGKPLALNSNGLEDALKSKLGIA